MAHINKTLKKMILNLNLFFIVFFSSSSWKNKIKMRKIKPFLEENTCLPLSCRQKNENRNPFL